MEKTQKIHTQTHHQRQNLKSDSSKMTHGVQESHNQIICRNNGGRRQEDVTVTVPRKTVQILYPAKVIFQTQRQIKTFSDKRRLKEFIAWGPALQKNTKGRPSG